MSEFNLGDRVVVITQYGSKYNNRSGSVLRIFSHFDYPMVEVGIDAGPNWLFSDQDLVPEKKLNAEAAYENAHLVSQDLLVRIRHLLYDLPAPGNDEYPINWDHVSSINEVNGKLQEVVTFLKSQI